MGKVFNTVFHSNSRENFVGMETATGFIFKDFGNWNRGYRFIEVAKNSIGAYVFGDDTYFAGFSGIGEAINNTRLVANVSTSRTNNAAKACLNYGTGTPTTNPHRFIWGIPTLEELNLIYTTLVQSGIWTPPSLQVWASDPLTNVRFAGTYTLTNGQEGIIEKEYTVQTLPIRYF